MSLLWGEGVEASTIGWSVYSTPLRKLSANVVNKFRVWLYCTICSVFVFASAIALIDSIFLYLHRIIDRRIRHLISYYSTSTSTELQQRSVEYGCIFTKHEELRFDTSASFTSCAAHPVIL